MALFIFRGGYKISLSPRSISLPACHRDPLSRVLANANLLENTPRGYLEPAILSRDANVESIISFGRVPASFILHKLTYFQRVSSGNISTRDNTSKFFIALNLALSACEPLALASPTSRMRSSQGVRCFGSLG